MNLYIRVIALFIRSLWRPVITDILAGGRMRLRVWPNDLDINGHMNNGRYLTIMDLGRMDLILRTGLLKMVIKHKSVPVLAAAKARWRMPLMPFQPFDLETRVVCWDEKWIYMEQRFLYAKGAKKGAVAAIAMVKGGFYDKKNRKTLPTSAILDMLDMGHESPDMPAHVAKWIEAEEALRDVTAV